jgi:hypothetical protein
LIPPTAVLQVLDRQIDVVSYVVRDSSRLDGAAEELNRFHITTYVKTLQELSPLPILFGTEPDTIVVNHITLESDLSAYNKPSLEGVRGLELPIEEIFPVKERFPESVTEPMK